MKIMNRIKREQNFAPFLLYENKSIISLSDKLLRSPLLDKSSFIKSFISLSLFSWSLIIFSSIVPFAISLIIWTTFFWPNLWTLSLAWFSTAGFHQGSKWITTSALVKLRPLPPAFKDIKNTLTSSPSLNLLTRFNLSKALVCPSI